MVMEDNVHEGAADARQHDDTGASPKHCHPYEDNRRQLPSPADNTTTRRCRHIIIPTKTTMSVDRRHDNASALPSIQRRPSTTTVHLRRRTTQRCRHIIIPTKTTTTTVDRRARAQPSAPPPCAAAASVNIMGARKRKQRCHWAHQVKYACRISISMLMSLPAFRHIHGRARSMEWRFSMCFFELGVIGWSRNQRMVRA
jgi:hypothetical protein